MGLAEELEKPMPAKPASLPASIPEDEAAPDFPLAEGAAAGGPPKPPGKGVRRGQSIFMFNDTLNSVRPLALLR